MATAATPHYSHPDAFILATLDKRIVEWQNWRLDHRNSRSAFDALSKSQQEQYRKIIRELMNLAQRHAIPMCFAPPLVDAAVTSAVGGITYIKLPLTLAKADGASGCIL